METQKERVLETVTEPDKILEGDFGAKMAVRHYSKTPLTSKYMVVLYKETNSEDGFIMTAYLTTEPSQKRKILWKR